ncbi:MAG TPA: prenyltransferase/squalene oxidase repeat-containing protein [Planctomycetota bacterium]|nr:prenyltransferase/squalene oxidase repeat-containing protein [Planctomycetota bacterium]
MRIAAAVLALSAGLGAQAQQAAPPKGDKTDEAIRKGLAFIVSKQDKDGAFRDRDANLTTMTALGLMALGAVGHQPSDETREGAAMKKALEFILRTDRQKPDGYYGEIDGSRMYGHGIITLMLCEMLGMGADAKMDQQLRDRAKKAVELILRSQAVKKDERNRGGWRYTPQSGDSDLSATVWQVMALRSARNAGLDVPKEAIDLAVGYIKRCYHSKRDGRGQPENLKSACGYEPGHGPRYAMAAAGLLSMQVCGAYDSPEVRGSADWLADHKINPDEEWFYYGTYYYAQGMFQRGEKHAEQARKLVEELLLARQQPDGAWSSRHGHENGAGKIYTTALAILSLAVKHHYLPIYQR